ncbi:MAG: tripartite tricarboxylate transporter substrate binding protein [Betaproteobacteria bacterium]|nr:tripartite tricarboxylate transporter substrate binding protein [Betaproteobacteria bacterium]
MPTQIARLVHLARIFAIAVLSAAASSLAQAQNFPAKPVTLICPWPPGGSSDLALRALAEATSKYLGQRVVVENRPGAAGTLGAQALAVSGRTDGYTVSQLPITVLRLPHMQKVQFDPLNDITYVLGLSGYTFGVVVRTDFPARNWKEFIEYARANPGKISYGTPGNGTSLHITMEQIADKLGLKFLHVPFKGVAESIPMLLGGNILAIADSTGWAPHVDSGKMRLLVTWGEHRTKRWPEVPTLLDEGHGIVQNSPYGLGAAKGTDPRAVRVLHDAFKKGMEDPIHVKMLERLDQDVWYKNSEDYARYARETYAEQKQIIDKLGLAQK